MKTFLCTLFFLLSHAAIAAEAVTVASPKCDATKIKQVGGDAIQDVKAADWKDGYSVTLDTAALSARDLTRKLQQAGCF